jgi:hypothetical protein
MLVELFSFILRVAEIAFAAIVAGITGSYLNDVKMDDENRWVQARFVYAMVVAALSILFAAIWLLPLIHRILHWAIDIFLSILWFVSFGLVVNFVGDDCGNIFNWQGISLRGKPSCSTLKADIAFSFLSAICWLASGAIGYYLARKHGDRDNKGHRRHHRWGRRSHV